MTVPAHRLKGTGRVLALTLTLAAIVIAAVVWLRTFGGQPIAPVLVRNTPFALLLSSAIGAAALGFNWMAVRLLGQRHAALRWTGSAAALVAAAAAGTLAASGVLFALGVIRADAIWILFRQNVWGAIPTTVAIGGFLLTVEGWQARLRARELAARAHRLNRDRAQRFASEAHLASLSARAQPHFLFNTLNAIASLVRDNPERAEHMAEQLSSLLRGSLDNQTRVSLDREMKLVDDYLQIQRARLGDRLRFAIETAADVRRVAVPPFVIQAIVEHAIKHAALRPEGMAIRVHAYRRGNEAMVDVIDDGDSVGESTRTGRGLDDMRARLASVYGLAAALELQQGTGTMTVRVRLPIESAAALAAKRR